jgi:hypothetical protein
MQGEVSPSDPLLRLCGAVQPTAWPIRLAQQYARSLELKTFERRSSGPSRAFHRIVCLVDWHRTNAAFIQTQRSFSKCTKAETEKRLLVAINA